VAVPAEQPKQPDPASAVAVPAEQPKQPEAVSDTTEPDPDEDN
jgi:hypothetical protein